MRFDLSVLLAEAGGGGLAVVVEYSTALFDAATIGRMAGHLGVLLAAVAADPARPLSGLGVLTAAERDQLLVTWNDTPAPVAAAGGIHELAAARAAAAPDVVAVVYAGQSLSYGGLEERANRLAHYLRGVGVGGESVVGLCLERGAGMVVAMLAVWKAGGAYLPLDPGYPPGRLAFMLADSHASVLVSRRGAAAGLAGELPAGQLVAITLDDPVVAAAVAAAPAGPPPAVAAAGQLAYVIYTSGSTGTPKGVQVTHGGLVNVAVALRPVFGAAAGVRVLQFASFSFDAATLDVAVVLAAGGTLAVATSAQRAGPALLAQLIRGSGAQVASVAPSLLGVLDPGDLPGITTLVVGVGAAERAAGLPVGAGRRLLNAYGPTETTVISCAALADPGAGQAPPIGSPIANTRVYVLDRYLGPVPVGVAGELFIGGAQGGAGVWRAAGADGGAVCGGLVRWGWVAAVPDGGPGAVAGGRGAGVPGPRR